MNTQCQLSIVTKKYLACYDCILQDMIQGMTQARLTGSISHNFIVQMIPHRRGAVQMSRNALQYEICSGLRPILEAIISSQEKGIAQMEQLLCSGECQS